jgi:ribonucleotide reductase alpha subunit
LDGTQERWHETVERVVNGTYRMQERHINAQHLGWDAAKAQASAQEMYERMWCMKFLPPGRGLWAMGSPLTEERNLHAALNNCGFTSTEHLTRDLAEPFTFLMDASMLGIGVGFDTKGAGKLKLHIPTPPSTTNPYTFLVADSREGWIAALKDLLLCYFKPNRKASTYDYSLVRPLGAPIKGFGGVASGPEPLDWMLSAIRTVLDRDATTGDGTLSVTGIVDIMNLIGKCVVAGNVRRTAEIAFGDPDSEEFINLKNYEVNPQRADYGWTSNNSIFAKLGMDYTNVATRVAMNGEPGFAWLDNMRAYSRMDGHVDNKDRRATGSNPCVPGHVPILTKAGWVPIASVVGQELEVWNGFEWSEVTPRVTGYDQRLVDVTLSNGVTLTCTPAHTFVLTTDYRGGTKRVSAQALQVGDKLLKHEWPVLREGEAIDARTAYTQGFVSGDGMDGYNHLWLYEPKYACLDRIACRYTGPEYYNINGTGRRQVCFDTVQELKAFVPHAWNLEGRLNWLAGVLDADGSSCNEGQVQLGSIDKDFLAEVQLMLTSMGVASKVRLAREAGMYSMPDGRGGMADYDCQANYRLLINAMQIQHLVALGLQCNRVDLSHQPARDASRFVTVESVVDAGTADVVYCFTDHKRNLGAFGGVVTGQCVEQTLESYELCCLCENFPNNHDSLEDFLVTLKYSYLYSKTVTLGNTPWPKTNRVLLRNRRIGMSQSGIQQTIAKLGIEEYRQWCEAGYDTIQRYDKVYSEWFAIPRSIKTTSVKPSGSVSLLAGATPGMHWPEAKTYTRRMRLSINSDLIGPLLDANYTVEPCVGDPSSVVVEIPVKIEDDVRTVGEVSMWEQLAMAAFLQRYWADNQVSSTITFDPEREGPQLANALNYYQYQLKGISFLPRLEYGAFPQMPYEACTEAAYGAAVAKLLPLNFAKTTEKAESERFCDSSSCVI